VVAWVTEKHGFKVWGDKRQLAGCTPYVPVLPEDGTSHLLRLLSVLVVPRLGAVDALTGPVPGLMSVEEWVTQNIERVQQLRDEATVSYDQISSARKLRKDLNCHIRTFKVGDSVYYRTPRLSETLEPSWQGPYTVQEVLGGPSYKVDVDGKNKCVYVRFMKDAVKITQVKRVTTVLEDDSENDEVICKMIKWS